MYSLYYFHSLFHLFHTPLPWQILFLSFTHTHFERITNTHTHQTHTHSLTVTKVGVLFQAAGGGLSYPNSPNAEVAEL